MLHKGLDEFRVYVNSVKVDEYDGVKLRGIVNRFGEVLCLHLKEEIASLMALERFGEEKLSRTWDELEKKFRRT